jgi:hypothetical protein
MPTPDELHELMLRDDMTRRLVAEARLAERERCARIVDDLADDLLQDRQRVTWLREAAKRIRKGE